MDWQVNLDYTSAEGKAYLDERKAMLDKEMARLSPKFSREAILEQRQNERRKKLQKYLEQRKQLQGELDSLGFFKRAEKEKLRKKLAENQKEIDYYNTPNEMDEEELKVKIHVEKYKMSVYAVIKVVGWALTATQIQDILKYYGLPTLSDPMRNFYTACGFDEKMNIHNMEYKGVLGDRCFYYLE